MKKTIKSVLLFVLVFSICFSIVGCGNKNGRNSSSDEVDIEEKIEDKVRARAISEVVLSYQTTGTPTVNITNIDVSDDEFTANGRVNVTDNYGDSYSGRFDAEGTISSSGSVSITEFDLETPTRSR